MAENTLSHPIVIDLDQFKLQITLKGRIELTLHFNSPSRRFYLSVIALLVNEMRKVGKVTPVPLEKHHAVLAMLNDTVGGSAGSSENKALLQRIYVKWKHSLPSLDDAPLFTILGRTKSYDEGNRKTYQLTETERDTWANLFEYYGSHEKARLRFAIDKIGVGLGDVLILYDGARNDEAWGRFIWSLQGPEKVGMKAASIWQSGTSRNLQPPGETRNEQSASLVNLGEGPLGIKLYCRDEISKKAVGASEESPRPVHPTKDRNVEGVQIQRVIRVGTTKYYPLLRALFLYGGAAIAMALLATTWVWPILFSEPPPFYSTISGFKIGKQVDKADPLRMAFSLPDQPSIAVLPFRNKKEDVEQDFLSDGITESIITAMAKMPKLFVIANNASFKYKGKPVELKSVSEELGVRYVLQGTVQKSADRIRITAQLADAITGLTIWAEKYDGEIKEILALQDRITINVLKAIQVKLTDGDQPTVFETWWKGERGLDCYLKYLEAIKHRRAGGIEDLRTADRLAQEILELCPEAAEASYTLSAILNYYWYWTVADKPPEECIKKGMEMAHKAIAINGSNSTAHSFLGGFYDFIGEHEKALTEGELAVALSPSGATERAMYAASLRYSGRWEESIEMYQQAIRLCPSAGAGVYNGLGGALFQLGRYEEAAAALKKAVQLAPKKAYYRYNLAAVYSTMGWDETARAEAAEARRLNPRLSLDSWLSVQPYKDPSVMDKYKDALRRIGVR